MGSSAELYSTNTVVDASPDRAATTVIGTVSKVSADPFGNLIRLVATVGLTPGADTTEFSISIYRGAVADGVLLNGAQSFHLPASEETAVSVLCIDSVAPGVYEYNVCIDQVGASADAAVASLAALAFVSN